MAFSVFGTGIAGCASHPGAARPSAAADWTLAAGAKGAARITFAFAPPNEDYAGQVLSTEGRLAVDCAARTATGQFVVRVIDIDMGEPELTENVQLAVEMLNGDKYETVAFQVKQLNSGEPDALFALLCAAPQAPGRACGSLAGDFRLKAATVPLHVPVAFEALPPHSLVMTGRFALENLKTQFDVFSPGPPDRLDFQFQLIFDRSLPRPTVRSGIDGRTESRPSRNLSDQLTHRLEPAFPQIV